MLLLLKHSFKLFRKRLELIHNCFKVSVIYCAPYLTHMKRQQIHAHKLGCVGFGGGNCNFRSCPCIEHIVRLSCNRASDYIYNGQNSGSLSLGLSERRKSIKSLSRLAYGYKEGVLIYERISVSEL